MRGTRGGKRGKEGATEKKKRCNAVNARDKRELKDRQKESRKKGLTKVQLKEWLGGKGRSKGTRGR